MSNTTDISKTEIVAGIQEAPGTVLFDQERSLDPSEGLDTYLPEGGLRTAEVVEEPGRLATVTHIGVQYVGREQDVPVRSDDVFQMGENGALRRTRSTQPPRTVREQFRAIDPDNESHADDARRWRGILSTLATDVVVKGIYAGRAVRTAMTPREPIGGWKKHGTVPAKPMVKDRVPVIKGKVLQPLPGTDQSDWRPSSRKK